MIAAPNQRLWEAVVNVLQPPGLAQDPRFLTQRTGVPVTQASGLEQAVVSEISVEHGTFIESDGVPLVRLATQCWPTCRRTG